MYHPDVTVITRRRLIAAGGVAVLLAAGGVAGGLSLSNAEPDPVRLTARIGQQFRFDQASGVLPVVLRNNGDDHVTITRLELAAPSVVTEPETSQIIVRPGFTRRIRLPLRPARCPEHGRPSGGPATVAVTLAPDDREVRLSAPDPTKVLGRLARAECAVQRVLRVADFAFGSRWRHATVGGDPLLRGELILVRDSAGPPLVVTGARGNVLFAMRTLSEPPWALDAENKRLAIPVEFEVLRCDLHALVEVKKRFVFSTWAKLSADEQKQHLELRADPALERRLNQLIADTCQK